MKDNTYKTLLNFKIIALTPIACLLTLKCHTKLCSQGQSYNKNEVLQFWMPDIKELSKHDRSLSHFGRNSHHVFGLKVE